MRSFGAPLVTEHLPDICQKDLSGLPKLLKNHHERVCNDISSSLRFLGLIPPGRFVGIQLEQQLPQKFRADWELIILTARVLQLTALKPSGSIIHGEDREKEGIEHLCLVPVPVYEVTIVILARVDVIFTLPFAINVFGQTPLIFPNSSSILNYS
ncbi:hypothetical protein TURU_040549 [Turdus rufiventris]|nr:hypothetical protein TURU_040549 [Turdus rufiventris]